MTVLALALAVTMGEGSVRAEGPTCESQSCELGAKPPASSFAPGKVDGAAVWQSGGYANVWFTTTNKARDTYKVAICGAASVEEVMFDGSQNDTKVASPKGKLSGCDLYSFETGVKVDGLRVKPQGNSFKLVVRKNDAATGYSIYLEDAVLAPRESHYHFRMGAKE